MKLAAALLTPILMLLPSCASRGPLDTQEIIEYDAFVRKADPQKVLPRMEVMADEPYILGGEKAENLTLEALALLRYLGDRRFAAELEKLTPRQLSATRLFLAPQLLGIPKGQWTSTRFPRTVALISGSRKITDWPTLEADRRAGGLTTGDEWP
ncbi:MAG: hypothetical protein JWO82_3434 [Akkermansiaceae bacterium]|nr:hypothetical protein [Akkermansiaceae bacterium]